MPNNSKNLTAKQVFSRKIQIFNTLCAEWNLNCSQKSTCLALIALSNGNPKFQVHYKAISSQIFKRSELARYELEKPDKFSPYSTQAVKRRLQSLEDYGKEIGIALLSWKHGEKKSENYTDKSSFKFWMLHYINSIYDDIDSNVSFEKANRQQIQDYSYCFAEQKIHNATPQEYDKPKPRRPKKIGPEALKKAADRLDACETQDELTEMIDHYVKLSEYYKSLAKIGTAKLTGQFSKIKNATSLNTGEGGLGSASLTREKQSKTKPLSKAKTLEKNGDNLGKTKKTAHNVNIRGVDVSQYDIKTSDLKLNPAQWSILVFEQFKKLGITQFEVSLVDQNKKAHTFKKLNSPDELEIRSLMDISDHNKLHYYIRPLTDKFELIQLDDLKPENFDKAKEFAFLGIKTSKNNFQVWLAFDRKLKNKKEALRQLIEHFGSDSCSPGVNCRMPGSVNYKKCYYPAFPRVELAFTNQGYTVTAKELLERKILTRANAAKMQKQKPIQAAYTAVKKRLWPDYTRALNEAPRTQKGAPDRSAADLRWATIALKNGFDPEEVAGRLKEVSQKANSRSMGYCTQRVKTAGLYLRKGGI